MIFFNINLLLFYLCIAAAFGSNFWITLYIMQKGRLFSAVLKAIPPSDFHDIRISKVAGDIRI